MGKKKKEKKKKKKVIAFFPSMAFDGQQCAVLSIRRGMDIDKVHTGMRGLVDPQRATTVPVSGVLNLRLNFQ